MSDDKSKELLEAIEEELKKNMAKYRYNRLSDGIAFSLSIVEEVAKKFNTEE